MNGKNNIITWVCLIVGIYYFLTVSCSQGGRVNDAYEYTDNVNDSISGFYVSEKYFNDIQKYKSPNKSQLGSKFIKIPSNHSEKTIMIENFHDGGAYLKIVKHGQSLQIHEIVRKDSTRFLSVIHVIDADQIIIEDEVFVKIDIKESNGRHFILEKLLFNGSYENEDGNTFIFDEKGHTSGFENYIHYKPFIDYFSPGMQVDLVGMSVDGADYEDFGFQFNEDTLKLFSLNCILYDDALGECVEVEFGERKALMWRK